jgi:hypothetical protein
MKVPFTFLVTGDTTLLEKIADDTSFVNASITKSKGN